MKWVVCLLFVTIFALTGCSNGGDDDDSGSNPTDDTVLDDTATGDDSGPAVDDDVDDDAADDTADDDSVTDDDSLVVGCDAGDYLPYWGNLHAHTSYSDGEQTPADAFAYARDVGELDIQIITDHLEQLYFPLPTDRWGKCNEQADAAYDPGTFIAACGFEYGSAFKLPFFQSTGHNNVFDQDHLFPAVQLDFHSFYKTLVRCKECVGQYNHPMDDNGISNWNEFEYFPDVDKRMHLYEFNSDGDPWTWFFVALDKGWHISPMWDQDNHGPDWGTQNGHRSGFWLPNLTREDLYSAMKHRRSFASSDKNATISVMADNTCWMGSILSGYSTLPLDIEAIDEDPGDGFVNIEVYGPGGVLLDTTDCGGLTTCTAQLDAEVTSPTYFVARATETDGDYLIAAPVWVEP